MSLATDGFVVEVVMLCTSVDQTMLSAGNHELSHYPLPTLWGLCGRLNGSKTEGTGRNVIIN